VFLFLVNASGAVMLFVYLATALAQIRIRRRLERKGEHPELPMWLFPWLSYAVVAAIVGVLVAMGTDAELRPQLMASVASLALASGAWLLAARRRHADDGTRTGYQASIDGHAMQGER
jgi:GABA permease